MKKLVWIFFSLFLTCFLIRFKEKRQQNKFELIDIESDEDYLIKQGLFKDKNGKIHEIE